MAIVTDGAFQFSTDTKLVWEKGLFLLEDSWDWSRTLHAAILLSRRVDSCLRGQRFLQWTDERHLQWDDWIHLFNDSHTAFDDQLQYEEWRIKNAEKQAKEGHWPSQTVIEKSRSEIDKFLGLDWVAEEQKAWLELDEQIRSSRVDWTNIPVQNFPFRAMIIDSWGQQQEVKKACLWRQDDGSLKLFYENPLFQEIKPVRLAA